MKKKKKKENEEDDTEDDDDDIDKEIDHDKAKELLDLEKELMRILISENLLLAMENSAFSSKTDPKCSKTQFIQTMTELKDKVIPALHQICYIMLSHKYVAPIIGKTLTFLQSKPKLQESTIPSCRQKMFPLSDKKQDDDGVDDDKHSEDDVIVTDKENFVDSAQNSLSEKITEIIKDLDLQYVDEETAIYFAWESIQSKFIDLVGLVKIATINLEQMIMNLDLTGFDDDLDEDDVDDFDDDPEGYYNGYIIDILQTKTIGVGVELKMLHEMFKIDGMGNLADTALEYDYITKEFIKYLQPKIDEKIETVNNNDMNQ